MTIWMFLILLVAIITGINMVHKAVSELKDQLARTRYELMQEIEKRR